jgi:hypothetical protein
MQPRQQQQLLLRHMLLLLGGKGSAEYAAPLMLVHCARCLRLLLSACLLL